MDEKVIERHDSGKAVDESVTPVVEAKVEEEVEAEPTDEVTCKHAGWRREASGGGCPKETDEGGWTDWEGTPCVADGTAVG